MKKDFSYLLEQTDEMLISLMRKGNTNAADVLYARYMGGHMHIARHMNAKAVSTLDEWTIADIFVDALMFCASTYDPELDAAFRTYLFNLYRLRLSRALGQYWQNPPAASLDAVVCDLEGRQHCLYDFVPVENNVRNTPTMFSFQHDISAAIDNIPDRYRELARTIVEDLKQGLSVKKASKKAGISYTKGRMIMKLLRKELEKLGYVSARQKDDDDSEE